MEELQEQKPGRGMQETMDSLLAESMFAGSHAARRGTRLSGLDM
jgi:hypothetical protein